jgi:hypothetical protein
MSAGTRGGNETYATMKARRRGGRACRTQSAFSDRCRRAAFTRISGRALSGTGTFPETIPTRVLLSPNENFSPHGENMTFRFRFSRGFSARETEYANFAESVLPE